MQKNKASPIKPSILSYSCFYSVVNIVCGYYYSVVIIIIILLNVVIVVGFVNETANIIEGTNLSFCVRIFSGTLERSAIVNLATSDISATG